jgi:microcystin degradation protein MlrC
MVDSLTSPTVGRNLFPVNFNSHQAGWQQITMRIISGGIQHETNTFATGLTTTEDFIRDSHLGDDLTGGKAIVVRYTDTETIHGGYLAGAEQAGFELVPVLNARAYPSGMVEKESFEYLKGLLVRRIEQALPADGVLLDLHGAMVTEEHEDAEAEILRAVKEAVGQEIPIVVTLDLHANISPDLANSSTVIIGYDTYPHVDMGERGREAAVLICRIVRGEVHPVQAYRQLPLLTMPPMQCTLREPMQSLITDLHEMELAAGMLTATIAMGFPFADIHDMGATVLATADGDRQLAEATADKLAARLWALKDQLQPNLTSIEDAMRISENTDGLVIFADGSDNPGGGAPSDGTVALQAMIDANFQGGLVVVMYDPETVSQAKEVGIGGRFRAVIGGKTDDRHGQPVSADVEVVAIGDGEYQHVGAMARGLKDTLGDTALLRVDGVEILTSSLRRQLTDRAMFGTVDVDVSTYRLLVVKSAVHFRADIGPLAQRILDGDTPGIHRPEFRCFEYKKVRRPVYPLDSAHECSL